MFLSVSLLCQQTLHPLENRESIIDLVLGSRDNMKRAMLLSRWQKYGGVMLIGYTAFRNLSMGKTVRDKLVREDLCTSLQV